MSSDFPSIDDTGSPWYTRGQLLLSNQFTIGALMKTLNATAAVASGGGVYGYFDQQNERVVVTYVKVPATGTTQPNTLQVAIYTSGKIEMIFGQLANSGTAASPSSIGTIGIAGGGTRARTLRQVKPVQFQRLKGYGAVYVPFGPESAIYEQFYRGTGDACHRGHDTEVE